MGGGGDAVSLGGGLENKKPSGKRKGSVKDRHYPLRHETVRLVFAGDDINSAKGRCIGTPCN